MSEELKEVKEKYKSAFEKLIDEEFNLHEVDKKLEQANLFFAPSLVTLDNTKTEIKSNYIRCLNSFFVEELEERDIEIIKSNDNLSKEIIEVVKRTYKMVITKRNAKTICYNPPTPERIINNGTIVLELSYGRNTQKVSDQEYKDFMLKQKQVITSIVEKIEKDVLEKWNVSCKILVEKRI